MARLCYARALTPTDHTRRVVVAGKKGIWLNAAGRKMVLEAMGEYLNRTTLYADEQRKRLTVIQNEAWALAIAIKAISPESEGTLGADTSEMRDK